MSNEIVSKITTKTFGKITLDDIVKLKDGEGAKLMNVLGKVTSYKVGTTPLGDYITFHGRFQAENALTGKIVYSGAMILPKTAQDLLYGQIDSLPEGVGVEFAFAVGYRREDTSAVKYVFTFEPLLEMASDDPILSLAAKVKNQQLALAAPKVTLDFNALKINKQSEPVNENKKVA